MKRWYNRKPETMQDWLLLFAVAAALLAAVWYLPANRPLTFSEFEQLQGTSI